HLGIMKDLAPQQQENVIQNFIRLLSEEEKAAIGITDVNKIQVDQNIQLDKLNEILLHKEVGGENIIAHAQHLGAEPLASGSGSNPSEPEKYVGQDENGVVLGQQSPTVPVDHGVKVPESVGVGPEVPRPADTPLSMEETQKVWSELPNEIKYPQSEIEATRYLTADIETLFPKPMFAPVSHEWLSLRDRNALAVIEQLDVNNPITRLGGSSELSEELEWPAITKIQEYIKAQGLTRELGYIPQEKEPLEDFLKRTLAEKVLKEGPARPFAQGRILR
ncbi:MAG: hypothetical protein Q7S52_01145, partial [bacterium]|nr:hypothetical protein [bacterium]